MIKYKFVLYCGSEILYDSFEEGDLYDDYDLANDAALYYSGCYKLGGEILHLSNPGDYEEKNEKITIEIEEVEV